MKSNQNYKNAALAALKGRWASAIVASIIFCGAIWAFSVPYMLSSFAVQGLLQIDLNVCVAMQLIYCLGMLLIVAPLTIGCSNAFLRLLREGHGNVSQNLASYAFNGYWRNIWGAFLTRFFIFLWSLLLIIPGLVKNYSYALTPYLLKEFPELSANQCINLSKKMMKGHKFDLFFLHLSFIGWIILAVLSAGIGLFWLVPYMAASEAAFYQEVKTEYFKS